MLIPLAVVAGVIYLIYKAVNKGSNLAGQCIEVQDPLTILKVRYAKGEISQEEYKRIREDLIAGGKIDYL
ncbi:MAG: SHOCT domain-containing protein [Eubacteriales bacterium]